jgi:hypothetical protein
MAKGFHYFKFIATEWLTGDICFEDYELQGIFINVCAIYWHRNGDVTINELQKRLKTDRLISLSDRFISVNESGKITIKFLDEQLLDAGHISKVNSENGAKGGRPKGASNKEKKPTAKRNKSESKAKKTQIELELELKIELELNKNKFLESLNDFTQTYDSKMLKQFFDYWTELNPAKTKMKFQDEKFFEVGKRLATWSRNQKQTFNKSEIKPQINISTI